MNRHGRHLAEAASIDALVGLVQDPTADTTARLAAGARLSALGDPRPGVSTLEPVWCRVEAGPFVMGADPGIDPDSFERESPRHEVNLPAFEVARYPVTNRQWQRFVEGGGYDQSEWWSGAGWQARATRGWRAPRTWQDVEWAGNGPNRPVTGVSLYEAEAFASWLSARTGYRVDIATEAEWEKAARGCDGRIYPYGSRLESGAMHVCADVPQWRDAPAPVGCYPQGASPWGAEDMVGNTYSWTTSQWGAAEAASAFAYPYDADDGRESPEGDNYRVVRGGAWSFPVRNARCSYRGKDRPEDAFNNLGVRLIRRRTPDPAPSLVAGKERLS